MKRALICGGSDLAEAAAVLGLRDSERPEVVVLDTSHEEAIARAAAIPAEIPRVVVADGATAALLRSAGVANVVSSVIPELLGPAVSRALPRDERAATRLVIVTAVRGGVGRTLLTANLARHMGSQLPLWLVDATGTGATAWWLGADARPWSELEPIVGELSVEHLRVVAAPAGTGVRVIGGPGAAPSAALLGACLDRLRTAGELVLLDAPLLADEQTRSLRRAIDGRGRVLVVSHGDPMSLATLAAHDLSDSWLIASQCRALGEAEVFRALPRDDASVAAAMSSRGPAGGKLGRAYAELAEILSIDAS